MAISERAHGLHRGEKYADGARAEKWTMGKTRSAATGDFRAVERRARRWCPPARFFSPVFMMKKKLQELVVERAYHPTYMKKKGEGDGEKKLGRRT